MIEVVKEIKDKKEKAAVQKQEEEEKKEVTRQTFLQCKIECVCKSKKCAAVGLKQCPTCFQVMKSVRSKVKCRVDGVKPKMILPAALKAKQPPRRLFPDVDESDERELSSSESEGEMSAEDNDLDSNLEMEDQSDQPSVEPRKILQRTWDSLSPPNKEEGLIGKWYGVAFETKRSSMLLIGKILRRFLKDEEGPVESLEIRCLKYKIGSSTILEDTPAHCPDISLFSLENIIYGPLEVFPVRGSKFNILDYPLVLKHFNSDKNIDRSIMLN